MALDPEPGLRRYDAIFVDMGYTLVYFEPRQSILMQEALRAAGAERSTDEIRAAADAVYTDQYRDAATATFPASPEYDRQTQESFTIGILTRLGLDTSPASLQAYSDALESRFLQPGVLRPYPEVLEVLNRLQAEGYRLGIISNWSWNLRERLSQVGLDGYFEVVVASAYAGCNKPHPGIFRHALRQMNVPAERAVYVGDSYWHDVVGARNAGMDAVLLDRSGTAGTLDCPVISDLWGVLGLLENRFPYRGPRET